MKKKCCYLLFGGYYYPVKLGFFVWLQAAGFGTLHVFANAIDPARVHGIVGKRVFFE